jgi:hypothetical protein
MAVKPSHFMKLKNREKPTGISTKIRKPIKLGMMKESPSRVFLRPRDRPVLPVTAVE